MMRLNIRVTALGGVRPPAGAPIYVQARDTTFEDAPAPAFAAATGKVQPEGDLLDTVELDVDSLPDSSIVWVHVDVDGDGRVSPGDFVTTVSYPIPRELTINLPVAVRKV
jgi:hypothetical protein